MADKHELADAAGQICYVTALDRIQDLCRDSKGRAAARLEPTHRAGARDLVQRQGERGGQVLPAVTRVVGLDLQAGTVDQQAAPLDEFASCTIRVGVA